MDHTEFLRQFVKAAGLVEFKVACENCQASAKPTYERVVLTPEGQWALCYSSECAKCPGVGIGVAGDPKLAASIVAAFERENPDVSMGPWLEREGPANSAH